MAAVAVGVFGTSALAQKPTAEIAHDAVAPSSQHQASSNQIDIAHHIANSHELETPFGVIHLPDNWKVPLGTDSHGRPRYLDLWDSLRPGRELAQEHRRRQARLDVGELHRFDGGAHP